MGTVPEPSHSAEHLVWRLKSVRPEMPAGWFLFDGKQIDTIVRSLSTRGEKP